MSFGVSVYCQGIRFLSFSENGLSARKCFVVMDGGMPNYRMANTTSCRASKVG